MGYKKWNIAIFNKKFGDILISLVVLTFLLVTTNPIHASDDSILPTIFRCSDDIIPPPQSSNRTNFFYWTVPTTMRGRKPQLLKFKEILGDFECKPNKFPKEFHWRDPQSPADHHFPPNGKKAGIELIASNMTIMSDGTLVWNKQESERHIYRKEDYCISKDLSGGWITFNVCSVDCSNAIDNKYLNSCTRKCCPPSQKLDLDFGFKEIKCSEDLEFPDSNHERPFIVSGSSVEEEVLNYNGEPVSNMIKASHFFGIPKCNSIKPIFLPNDDLYDVNFKIFSNGTLAYTLEPRPIRSHSNLISKGAQLTAADYCIDKAFLYSSYISKVILACPDKATEAVDQIHAWHTGKFLFSLNLVSTTLLVVTVVVCVVLLCKGRNNYSLQIWLQLSYAMTLLIPFALFILVHTGSMYVERWFCVFNAWPAVVFYFSSFFWLTSMSFDSWWKIASTLQGTTLKLEEWQRFLISAIFSIAIPLLVSGNVIFSHQLYDEHEAWCFLDLRLIRVPVLYGTAWALLLINVLLVTSTLLHLRRVKGNEEIQARSNFKEDKMNFSMYAKLFIMTGILLISELIFSLLSQEYESINIKLLLWLFSPLDVLRSLQGAIIFVMFVCKPSVIKKILFRCWGRQGTAAPEENEDEGLEL